MAANHLSENLKQLRKQAGMTQEALSKRLSISTQAVSRWERGGAPDIELLPQLAEVFGVSLDTLFGCPSRYGDSHEFMTQQICSTPPEARIGYANQLAWQLLKATAASLDTSDSGCYRFFTSNEGLDRKGSDMPENLPTLTYAVFDSGFMQASTAKDFRYTLFMPEPEDGFSAIMKNCGDYQRFFACLAKPHWVELLAFFYTLKEPYYFMATLPSEKLGIPLDETESILQEMYECRLVQEVHAEASDGIHRIYRAPLDTSLVAFLYMATEVMRTQNMACVLLDREKPIFNRPLGAASLSPHWRTRKEQSNPIDILRADI